MKKLAHAPTTRWGVLVGLGVLAASACFRESQKGVPKEEKKQTTTINEGALGEVAKRRGMTDVDLINAVETYVPTGGRDNYIGLIGTGTGGKMAAFGIPSMRLLKYVGVFTPEPWQGFAYDDESTGVLKGSAREEIQYDFGDMGKPTASMTDGRYDGKYAFSSDAANGRIAQIDLKDFETKRVLLNPLLRTSDPDLTITHNSEYVIQTSATPEIFSGEDGAWGGLTFWPFRKSSGDEHEYLSADGSVFFQLPPYFQGQSAAGRGVSADYVFTLGSCADNGPKAGEGSQCGSSDIPSMLHILNWKKGLNHMGHGKKVAETTVVPFAMLVSSGDLRQVQLPAGAESMSLSSDGQWLAVGFRFSKDIVLFETSKLMALAADAKDAYGIPTAALDRTGVKSVAQAGPATGLAFGSNGFLYAASVDPNRLVRIEVKGSKKVGELPLDFAPNGIEIPQNAEGSADEKYAILYNPRPDKRFVRVGPHQGMNSVLVDVKDDAMRVVYDMAVPQATAIRMIAMPQPSIKAINSYKLGTDTRTDNLSPYKTMAGQERIVRDGKHVHVFATLIRSHLNPEIIEVDEGDTVSIHLTNLEQAQDQTHGFTVSTYNVHGSWEPGKTASVTFVADRPGVFPTYCTEFCSALHLEMQGYLLVKPKGWKPGKGDFAATATGNAAEDKAAYEAKMKSIADTQAVIDSVVAWLKENHFEKEPRAAALVNDAVEQLEAAKGTQAKIDAAVKAEDWATARLWAEQFFQYQVKAADAGLRAKKVLTEQGGKK